MSKHTRLDRLENQFNPPPPRPRYFSFSETPDPAALRCDQTGENVNPGDLLSGDLPRHLLGMKVYIGVSPDDWPAPDQEHQE